MRFVARKEFAKSATTMYYVMCSRSVVAGVAAKSTRVHSWRSNSMRVHVLTVVSEALGYFVVRPIGERAKPYWEEACGEHAS